MTDLEASLGPMTLGAYASCVDCLNDPPPPKFIARKYGLNPNILTLEVAAPIGVWARYDDIPLCWRHALSRAGPQVPGYRAGGNGRVAPGTIV